jgi:hypothetical protein
MEGHAKDGSAPYGPIPATVGSLLDCLLKCRATPDEAEVLRTEIDTAIGKSRFLWEGYPIRHMGDVIHSNVMADVAAALAQAAVADIVSRSVPSIPSVVTSQS